jgi:hypothetical protein
MIAGAAVGTILVCIIDSTGPGLMLGIHLVAGATIGLVLGLLVGRARPAPRPESG